MSRVLAASSVFVWMLAVSPSARAAEQSLEVVSVRASEISAHVNAHLLLGEHDALLVDATMTLADADEVVKRIEASGRRLRTIFITNSQPDKYLGLPRLQERFPDARIVSTPEVAAEIAQRGPKYLERLRNRYGDRIATRLVIPEPHDSETLDLEGHAIRIHRFRGGECPNAAALYVPSMSALFSGAIVFEGSHPFLRERDIPGWRRHLDWIHDHSGIERIHPGHGSTSGPEVLGAMRRYFADFEAAIELGDPEAAIRHMIERYPDHALDRLLREYSVPAYLPGS